MAEVSIKSPQAFRESIFKLSRNGLSEKDREKLMQAKRMAEAQLRRSDISLQEKLQFEEIANTFIPPAGGKYNSPQDLQGLSQEVFGNDPFY